VDTLCRRNVAISTLRVGLENGPADKLADQVDLAVLIRDGYHYADWDRENRTDSQD
jgi:hypothetical protein